MRDDEISSPRRGWPADDRELHCELAAADGVEPWKLELWEELDELRFDSRIGEVGYGRWPAVLMIGCQRAFMAPASALGAELNDEIQTMRRLLAAARRVAVPVIYSVAVHDPARDSDLLLAKEVELGILAQGSPGAPIHPALEPQGDEERFETAGASALFGNDLAARLAELQVDTLLVIGGRAGTALVATAADAAQRGLRVVVPRECVGDRSPEALAAGLMTIQRHYGDVVEIGEVLAFLERIHIEWMSAMIEDQPEER
jgi:nicotinamidase-related amidase